MRKHIFLQWIHDRLINVYGENIHYDYMIRLRKIIAELEKEDEDIVSQVEIYIDKEIMKKENRMKYRYSPQRKEENI